MGWRLRALGARGPLLGRIREVSAFAEGVRPRPRSAGEEHADGGVSSGRAVIDDRLRKCDVGGVVRRAVLPQLPIRGVNSEGATRWIARWRRALDSRLK